MTLRRLMLAAAVVFLAAAPAAAQQTCTDIDCRAGRQAGYNASMAKLREGQPAYIPPKDSPAEYLRGFQLGWDEAVKAFDASRPSATAASVPATATKTTSSPAPAKPSPLAAPAPTTPAPSAHAAPAATREDTRPATPEGEYVVESYSGWAQVQIQGHFTLKADGTYINHLYKGSGRWTWDRNTSAMKFTGNLDLGPARFRPGTGRGKRGMIVFDIKPDVKWEAYRQ